MTPTLKATNTPTRILPSNAGSLVVLPDREPEETIEETPFEEWQRSIYRGSAVLDIPPRRWLSKGWLPLDAVGALYAPPGAGKSFYALSLSLEVARGGEWPYALSTALPVLYVAGERATDLRDRAEAWQVRTGETIPDSWHLLSPRHAPQLTRENHAQALVRTITDTGSRFVVLDTYAAMTIGLEENSSKDTGPVIEKLAALREATRGGIVLVVHHTGKDATKGLRGSSSLLGAVDFTIQVTGTPPHLQARIEKSNAGPAPVPEWYTLDPVTLPPLPGEIESRSVPVLVGSGRPPVDPDRKAAVLALFDTHIPAGSASTRELIEAYTDSTGDEIKPATMGRTLKELTDTGELTKAGKGRATRYARPSK